MILLRATALIWAVAWSSFVLAAVWGESWRGWVIGAIFVLVVWGLMAAVWWKPRFGGLAMAGAGVWAGNFFHSQAAMVGLVAPAVALGVGFLFLGMVRARRIRKARGPQIAHTATNTDIPDADTESQTP